MLLLILMLLLGFGLLFYLIKKAEERKKEYQPLLVNIFKEKGFTATDLIWTNCKQIIRSNRKEYVVHNIVLGAKNGMLSFFGGGIGRAGFANEDKKVAFGIPHQWKKLLKENDDILLSNGFVAQTLFPKNDEKKFKHLFDIPINSIIIEGEERGKKVELFIEYSGNWITLSPYCNNVTTGIQTANTIIELFGNMVNDTLSYPKIYKANRTLNDAYKEDAKITEKRNLKILGAVVGTTVAIGGLAARSGARNWSKDR